MTITEWQNLTEKEEKMPINKGISPSVLKYLDERVRLNVYIDDLMADLGLTKQQVLHAMHYLKETKHIPIETITNGVYKYDPSKKEELKQNGRALFECIGESKQGKLVLQDENGELYVAEKL